MTVLVTGATGFVGGHVVRALRNQGEAVRAMVRDVSSARSRFPPDVELIQGDVTCPEDVDRAVRGCEAVYHFAALHRQAKYPDEMYWAVNARGTENLVQAALRRGVRRFLHCSTVGVHGNAYVPADEHAPFAPEDIYQETKLAAERAVRSAMAEGLQATIVRPVGIYGPGDMRFLKLFRTVQNQTFRMIGSGDTVHHLMYIDDLVAGVLLCARHERAAGEAYILAGPRYTSLNDLVRATARAVGRPPPRGHVPLRPVMLAAKLTESVCRPLGIEPPLHTRRVGFFVNDRGFCSDKAARELGYVPRVDLDEGLARTVQWYRSVGVL